MRLLDLYCGRFGWGREFARRGWEVVGIDLVAPPEIPEGCTFVQADILKLRYSADFQGGQWFIVDPETQTRRFLGHFDFVCASSPCEQFSVHGMKHFHPNPKYPELGLQLFNHTRAICEAAGVPYVMENVRAAQKFVGDAVHHCGPFYLWGNAVPTLLPKAGIISKGIDVGSSKIVKAMTIEERRVYRAQFVWNQAWSSSKKRKRDTAKADEIPFELASCVADYAENCLAVLA